MRWIYGRCSSILPTSLYWPYQGLVNRDTCSSGHFSHELRGCSTSGQKHHRNLSGSISGLFAQDQTEWSKNGIALCCQLLSPGPHIPRAPREATGHCPSPPPSPRKGTDSCGQDPPRFPHEKLNSQQHAVRFKVLVPFPCTWNQLHWYVTKLQSGLAKLLVWHQELCCGWHIPEGEIIKASDSLVQ